MEPSYIVKRCAIDLQGNANIVHILLREVSLQTFLSKTIGKVRNMCKFDEKLNKQAK